jgi:curved DNA-binding protein CbpA
VLQSQDAKDPYQVLQVDACAEMVVIKAAYRALARRYHPDGDTPDHHRMAALNAAYEVLRDPELRRRHDIRRAMGATQPVPIHAGPRRADAWAPTGNGGAGETLVLDFGRYAGWSIRDLARQDPDYLRWLCRHSSGIRFREAIARALPREPDLQRRSNSVA